MVKPQLFNQINQVKLFLQKLLMVTETIDVSKLTPGVYYIKNNGTGSTQQVTIVR